jgi:5-methylcytosine-specific restriction endonuclease McrA
MTSYIHDMVVFAELTADEVCPLLGVEHQHNDKAKTTFTTDSGVYVVKINSKRLQCFARSGIACVRCGIKGSIFRIEKHASDKQAGSPHLNLYAKVNDELVLLTQDHIVPKSKGGKDHLNNLQTMCYLCNEAKGASL